MAAAGDGERFAALARLAHGVHYIFDGSRLDRARNARAVQGRVRVVDFHGAPQNTDAAAFGNTTR
jgi:hypothetical protein